MGDIFSLIEQVPRLWRWILAWRFRRVFGRDVGKEYHIIYFIKDVQDREIVFGSPKSKRERRRYANATNLTCITPCADTRAMGHLVYSFGENVKLPPTMDSDVDADERMDISFVSIGGTGNLKTCDLLEDASDFRGFEFKGESILWRTSILVTAHDDVDYALIIKIHPESNPERTWICCAGVGEWGTSGAAWFLARKWKEIHKWAGNKPFAIITKTQFNSDESTVMIHRFRNSEDVDKVARESTITTTTTTTTTRTDTKQTTVTAAPGPMQ
ncbi:MAG TPA: hypothetical protein VMX13_05080 [Sedimentisphaerales bacterium]|nr:hypothetical protein [Sedimentisphaerales bacterium]